MLNYDICFVIVIIVSRKEVSIMAAFLKLVAQLGTKAAKWAWANKGTVINWIKNGATFSWISDKIDSIIN